MKKNTTIGKKLGLGLSLMVVLFMAVGFVSFNSIQSLESHIIEYRELAKNSLLMSYFEGTLLKAQINVKDFIITGKDKDYEEYKNYHINLNQILNKAESEIIDSKIRKNSSEIKKEFVKFNKAFQSIHELSKNEHNIISNQLNKNGPEIERGLTKIMKSAFEDSDPSAAYHSGIVLRHVLLARLYVLKYINDQKNLSVDRVRLEFKLADEEFAILTKQIDNPFRKTVLSDTIFKFREYEQSFTQLHNIIVEMEKLKKEKISTLGDQMILNTTLIKDNIKKNQDILGPALIEESDKTINILVLVSIIGIITSSLIGWILTKTIIRSIKKEVDDLSSASHVIFNAAQNLASQSKDLSQNTNRQASNIQETASSLEETTAMIENNVSSAESASVHSNEIVEIAEKAQSEMKTLIKSMKNIAESNEKIQDLVAVIKEVAKKTAVIDEIVFETKLLSFNASVEAERAGEHGRGFAVVANEVGNLAQMSGKAALEISEIIEKSVNQASNITSENRDKVTQGQEYVTKVAEILALVCNKSTDIRSNISQILEASKDQSQGVSQVNEAMTNIDNATNENAASTEQIARASNDLNTQSKNLGRIIIKLKNLIVSSDESESDQYVKNEEDKNMGSISETSRVIPLKRKIKSESISISNNVANSEIEFEDEKFEGWGSL